MSRFGHIVQSVLFLVLLVPLIGQTGPCGIGPSTGGGGTSIQPPPAIPDQPNPPPVVDAGATYMVTVVPAQGTADVVTTLFVYDQDGQELNMLRNYFEGYSGQTFTYALPIGTYRFTAMSVITVDTPSGELGSWTYYGFVDVSASRGEEVAGAIEVNLLCDPGTMPGSSCQGGDTGAGLQIVKRTQVDLDGASSGLALSPDESKLYVAYWEDENSSRVQEFSLPDLSLLQTFTFGGYHTHMDVVVSRDGNRIFTTNYYYDSISQLDLANGNTRTDLSTHDSWPADIAITPDEAKVLVSVGRDGRRYDMDNDSIAIYNIRNGEFSYIASVVLDDEISGKNIGMSLDSLFAYVPTRPRKSPMPRLYELSLVSPYQVTRVMELQGTEATALAGVVCIGDRVFVADRNGDRVWVVDRTSWTRNAYSLGFSPTVLAQHPSGRYIFAAAQADGVPIVVAIDVSSMSVAARYDGLPSEINDIEFSSDGTKMYMCRRHQQGAIVVFSLSW